MSVMGESALRQRDGRSEMWVEETQPLETKFAKLLIMVHCIFHDSSSRVFFLHWTCLNGTPCILSISNASSLPGKLQLSFRMVGARHPYVSFAACVASRSRECCQGRIWTMKSSWDVGDASPSDSLSFHSQSRCGETSRVKLQYPCPSSSLTLHPEYSS